MAKKTKAVYAPGELDRVRGKLGDIDEGEAKRMAQILGGEVGTERTEEQEAERHKKPVRRENVDLVVGRGSPSGRSGRRIDLASPDDDGIRSRGRQPKAAKPDPGDDPSKPLKTGYFERVKMDRYAGQIEFEIKSPIQILVSVLSLFSEPVDYVNSRFVTKRMNDYYSRIEQLVTGTRSLLPPKNARRNNQLKRASPFVYNVLDIIRSWNIESIAGEMSGIQSHPRSVRISEFSNILRFIYKPIFILENLDMETHIKGSFKLLYKILYIENPMDAKDKYQEVIRNILVSFADIRRDLKFYLYPMLMKLISDRFFPYERFFTARHNRFMAFLNTSEAEKLSAADLTPQQIESMDAETLNDDVAKEQAEGTAENPEEAVPEDEDPDDPKVIARKARQEAARAESKALERGLTALEALFPKAGWDRLSEFPDLYPYFAETYNLRRGFELIAPTDPLQQIAVLMHILEDIFFAMRYVKFGTVSGSDGRPLNVDDYLGDIINYWRSYVDNGFMKEYLPRLVEYCRVLENSSESRTSPYMRKTVNELHWVKRLYFLPLYKFESVGPPPFQKQDVTPIYGEIRTLRKYLTSVAMGIELGMRKGGAEAKAHCDGINNPWENYNFEVPNAVSKRLEALLPPAKKNNASLIFFSLSAVTVLDYIINNEDSWSYGGRPGPLFRSIKGEGITPMFGVDNKLDAEKIFKDSLKKKE